MLTAPTLAIAMHGLTQGPPRAAIDWAAAAGFRAIQLDAAAATIRPRELDRSARRDLAAILRRVGLACSGLDLWIPPEHLADPARSQRAHDTILQSLELSADLAALGAGGGPVSITLPPACPSEILSSLADHSARHAVRIADHSRAKPLVLDLGLDPAAALLAQQDPLAIAASAGNRLASARLSDASLTGRVTPGARGGRLDIQAYIATLAVVGYARPIVLDLRGIDDPDAAARSVHAVW